MSNHRNIVSLAAIAFIASSASAGRIVANNDEWTLSDSGFASPSDPGTFALNVVDFLTGAPTANPLV